MSQKINKIIISTNLTSLLQHLELTGSVGETSGNVPDSPAQLLMFGLLVLVLL